MKKITPPSAEEKMAPPLADKKNNAAVLPIEVASPFAREKKALSAVDYKKIKRDFLLHKMASFFADKKLALGRGVPGAVKADRMLMKKPLNT